MPIVSKRCFRAVLAIAFGLLVSACNEETVLSGLSQADANQALRELDTVGIDGSRTAEPAGTFAVAVPAGEFAKALHALGAVGFPNRASPTVPELFPGDGLIVTPFEMKARLAYAIDEEVRRQILQIDGVVDAVVRIAAAPETRRFQTESPPPTASAVIRIRGVADHAAAIVKVKTLISAAVPGLSYDRVTVVAAAAPVLRGPQIVAPVAEGSNRPLLALISVLLFAAAVIVWFWPQVTRMARPSA